MPSTSTAASIGRTETPIVVELGVGENWLEAH